MKRPKVQKRYPICRTEVFSSDGAWAWRVTRDGELFAKGENLRTKHAAQEACLQAFKKAQRPIRVEVE